MISPLPNTTKGETWILGYKDMGKKDLDNKPKRKRVSFGNIKQMHHVLGNKTKH